MQLCHLGSGFILRWRRVYACLDASKKVSAETHAFLFGGQQQPDWSKNLSFLGLPTGAEVVSLSLVWISLLARLPSFAARQICTVHARPVSGLPAGAYWDRNPSRGRVRRSGRRWRLLLGLRTDATAGRRVLQQELPRGHFSRLWGEQYQLSERLLCAVRVSIYQPFNRFQRRLRLWATCSPSSQNPKLARANRSDLVRFQTAPSHWALLGFSQVRVRTPGYCMPSEANLTECPQCRGIRLSFVCSADGITYENECIAKCK